MEPAARIPLSEECRHYTEKGEVPWDIQKYWAQRYSMFSNYDDGIVLTDASWFGVTPEPVATYVASDIVGWDTPKTTIIDLFAGAGGNVIAFALSDQWTKIIAIEKDAATLACAQHNADLYGVGSQITWVHGDCFDYLDTMLHRPGELAPALAVDAASAVLFASPPWGGPGYSTDEVFDLSTMQPYNLATLHEACRSMDHALYLPRSSDIRQIARLVPDGKKIDVVQYCMDGASKAMVAYLPAQPSPSTQR